MRLALLVLIALPSCGVAPARDDGSSSPAALPMQNQEQPPRFVPISAEQRLYRSEQSAGGEGGVRVLRTREAWEASWANEIHQPPTAPPSPAVDFTRDEVVAVFLGQVSSGGHEVEILGAARTATGAHHLRVRRTRPAAGCMTTAVMGAPVDVVRLPRSTGEPVVTWETQEAPCQ